MASKHDGWIDLADRASDGLEVTLFWSRTSGSVKVAVQDSKLGQAFELDVAGAEALAAFQHPFAYASRRRGGRVAHTHTDLQLQS
jgi:hypothetical protein